MDNNEREKTGADRPGRKKNEVWWLPPIFIFVRASAWIAFPVIAALYIGNWLDAEFGTGQKLLLASIAAAFVVSMSGLTVFSLREMKKMKEADKKPDGTDGSPEDKAPR
jgi:hypothetical protein